MRGVSMAAAAGMMVISASELDRIKQTLVRFHIVCHVHTYDVQAFICQSVCVSNTNRIGPTKTITDAKNSDRNSHPPFCVERALSTVLYVSLIPSASHHCVLAKAAPSKRKSMWLICFLGVLIHKQERHDQKQRTCVYVESMQCNLWDSIFGRTPFGRSSLTIPFLGDNLNVISGIIEFLRRASRSADVLFERRVRALC
eukprot:1081156-Amphidinium_carterae.1